MNDFRDFILARMPAGAIVVDQRLNIVYSNRQAELFFRRHELPGEVMTICRRVFDAIRLSKVKEMFPGEIHLHMKLQDSPGNWTFRLHINEEDGPFVAVFIVEESLSNRIDLNSIRREFKLTRRETDVVRRLISGLRNTDIADDLEISEQTVKDHLSNIYMKLGVENRFTLVSFLLGLAESGTDK
jgi:DNA-binding CsgD family transcriptional regulator